MNLWKNYKTVVSDVFPDIEFVERHAEWTSDKGVNLTADLYKGDHIIKSRQIEIWDDKDPSAFVLDEWVGQWIALWLLPHSFIWGLVAFFWFRVFDIFIIFPCSNIRVIIVIPFGLVFFSLIFFSKMPSTRFISI